MCCIFHRCTTTRKRTRFHVEDTHDINVNEMDDTDEFSEKALFLKHIFYVAVDDVNGRLAFRFSAGKQISDTFSFLWN